MSAPSAGGRVLVYGFGTSGEATARHLVGEGVDVLALDDDDGPRPREAAAALGVDLVVRPDADELARLAAGADEIVVSPGVPAAHRIFSVPGARLVGEVELAWRRARVPIVAVTGTNGKTTVATLVASMLCASGVRALAAGNIGHPLLDAVGADVACIVAEVSSFQLALTRSFRPAVGAWCNFSPDHLDWHGSLDHYRSAKARIWANAGPGTVAVANAEDPVVMAAAAGAADAGAAVVTFATTGAGDFRLEGDELRAPGGDAIARVDELARRLPHDLANALCAAAAATAAGATPGGCHAALVAFTGLPHRVELVGEANGVRFYDDSKATTPGATLAALAGFESAVLIAGGRNKGLDLSVLRHGAAHLRAVVAIGEAAPAVTAAFEGACPVLEAGSMDDAVSASASLARPGDAVVLSPACASFDWYTSYGERGDDFARAVRAVTGAPGRS
ncbi:MAG TPA: UDP-N-acetylmuramoyl-L-alanine--D-glutamate ligase [Acidimicrobiales bacterium]|nr:UDP-N-acetylmuramoyl-L-alanine--D-glutamate ligase [Acidimicrobiales bacterium]